MDDLEVSEVHDRLAEVMQSSFNEVLTYSRNHRVSLRIGAYMLAIDRVAYHTKLRGIYA